MSNSTDKLSPTPPQIEGPFYPVRYQKEEGNDLTKGVDGRAEGEIILIAGRVLNTEGKHLQNVLVETWQADNNGRYDHPGDEKHPSPLDKNFQYWGKTVTDNKGCYSFRTIKPAPYNDEGDWRTPHVHFKLYLGRNDCILTTQMYFVGEKLNAQDNHLGALPEEQQNMLLTHPAKVGNKFGLDSNLDIYEFNIVIEA